MQAHHLVRLLTIAMASLLVSCTPPDADPGPSAKTDRTASESRFENIEKLAQQSCLCKLAGHNSSKIDDALKVATKGLEKVRFGESSAPLAGTYDCYPELGEQACTATYYVTASPNSPVACDLGQVAELEKAWKSVPPASDGSADAANEALKKRLSELQQVAANSIPRSACN